MQKKKCVILGSTGSIGAQALAVARETSCVEIMALTANRNSALLEEQILAFSPHLAVLGHEQDALALRASLRAKGFGNTTEILWGREGLLAAATYPQADIVLNALVGNIGLEPTVAAIKAGKDIALANKETLVSAGQLVMELVKEHGVSLYPVDSEHSAIFQCLQGNEGNEISRIHLTASGGPFRTWSKSELAKATPEQALKHPNWDMGPKITIDSATMMNKGLEVIEAKWLFDLPSDRINVLVHPQSMIHSMVEFIDGAVMAQLGEPDMRVPIQYALTYPRRLANTFPKLDFWQKPSMTFEKPDFDLFPCLRLAFEALKAGGTIPAVMNATNEVAVAMFLGGQIGFLDIARIIETTMSAYTDKKSFTLEDVFEADSWARAYAGHLRFA